MKFRQTDTPPVAAAKASFSTSTAYRFEKHPRLPSQKKGARERRRPDPLADVFDAEVVPMLKAAPGLRRSPSSRRCCGATPNSAPASAARWSAGSAPGAPSMAKSRRSSSGRLHEPGRAGLSDFTDMGDVGITVAGAPLDHRLYHFRLAYSGLRACPCRPRRRELRRPGRGDAERPVVARRRAAGASHRQPLGRLPQSRRAGPGRPDPPLRSAVRPLPHDADPQQCRHRA